MKLLLIEDNKDIYEALKFSLEENNYNVYLASTISIAKTILNEIIPDVIILDITLPDGNGFELYEKVIKPKNIPTCILTANAEEESIVKGLELGADDYITKPFGKRELLARIKRIISKKENIINIANLSFDIDNMIAKKDNELIEFTALELKILFLLLSNKGNIIKRETILDKIWSWTGNDVDDHTVTVYIKRIKDKLGVDIIRTIKGLGYVIDEK